MKRFLIAAGIILACSLSARAADDAGKKQMTVDQCISILRGLHSLDWAGQQLDEPISSKPADAKSYKLGSARMTIALDIDRMQPIFNAAQQAHQAFIRELPALPAAGPPKPDNSPDTARADAAVAQNRASEANWAELLRKPCPVTPAHLEAAELKIGEGDDKNAIPPSVLGALVPIIDGLSK